MTFICLPILAVSNQCTVSEWGEWKEKRPRHDNSLRSFPTDADLIDGAAVRKHNMKVKDDLMEYRRTCRAEGTCPELMARASEGAIECLNGVIDGPTDNDVLCNNINQQSFLNFVDLQSPEAEGNDCWGWTSADGREIAIMGLTTGTTFVDITNPSAPVVKAFMPGNGNPSTWRDMKVVNDWVFVVSEASGHGIQAFDLSRLSQIGAEPEILAADYIIGGRNDPTNELGNCHNIVANPATNKIYAVGCTAGAHCATNGGLYIVDVADPANPVIPDNGFNCYDGDGYVHDAQCVVYKGPDTAYTDRDICFSYNEDTFTIVDVTDPFNMVLVSRTGYPGSAYTHQGWVTEDHTVVLLDDELDEQGSTGELRTYLWDVRDLDAPVLMNTHYHGIQSIDHNQYIVGDYTYQANYMSGLRVLQIDQVNFQLTEVGYFDVFPSLDNDNFFGSWSVYPYFASGNIVISSIDYGMYVVSHEPFASPKTVERQRYRSILNAGNGVCPSLVQTEQL